MLQKTGKRPGPEPEKTPHEKNSSVPVKKQKGQKALKARFRELDKEDDGNESAEKENDGIKGMLDFTVLLTSLMTLLAWRTMDLAKAEYEGKAFTYWFCQIAIVIILAAMFLHLAHMIGYKRWKAVYTWILGAPKAARNFWKSLSRRGKARIAAISLVPLLLAGAAYFFSWPRYCTQVTDCFGIPVAGDTLSQSERQGLAGYWRMNDYPLQHRMTLTYVEAYRQLDVMSEYSTLYERAFFQPTARIEIEYRKDKEYYKDYPEDYYSSASRIDYRVPIRISYYNSSNKLVLELERDSYNNMEIVTYVPEAKPQLLNATLLRIPDGQTGEKGILGQKIETVYRSDGLPELRRLYSDAYNLYGVNGERYTYNRDQQVSSLCYLDAEGEPTCNKLGVMMVEFEYQDDANLQSIRYYGDQKGSERVEGFHGVFCEILEYDEEGKNIVSRRQKDRSESLCFDKNGVYQYHYQYKDSALVLEEFLAVDNAPIQNIRFNSCWVRFQLENLDGRRICVDLDPVITPEEDRAEALSNTLPTPETTLLFNKELPVISSEVFSSRPETTAGVPKDSNKAMAATDAEPAPSRRYSRIRYTLKNGVVTEISYWDKDDKSVPGDQGCAATRFEYDHLRLTRESYWDSNGQPCVLSGGYTAVEYVYDSHTGQDLEKMTYLDAQAHPVMNRNLGCAIVGYERSGARQEIVQTFYYDKDKKLIPLPDKGYAKTEQRYDTNGYLIQETFYDAHEAIACRTDYGVAKIRYEYAPDGNLIRESYWDQEDNAVSRRDTGYAVVNQTFTHGQLTEKRFETYRNRAYYPTPDRKTGVNIITYRYKDGQKVEEQYLDGNRNPVLSTALGCASLLFEYDRGRLSKKSALGLQQERVLRTDTGCSIEEYYYDDFGRKESLRYLDTDEKLICRSDTGCAEIRYEYDNFGRHRSIKYYDTAGQLVMNKKNGYAGVVYEYPDGNNQTWRYIGLDGEPFPRQGGHGITVVNKLYDSTGMLLGENYQDADGQPAVWQEHGYSALSHKYDENGQETQTDFLGPDENLVLRRDQGYARHTYEYDSAGRVIRMQYHGENQEPVVNTKYHCAGFEYEYDERGLKSVIRYLGPDGKEAVRPDYGISEIRQTYDSAGNLTGEAYYIDNRPAVRKERGYASYEYTYENGLWMEGRYYDTEGTLVSRLDHGYAIIRLEYDTHGRCIREHYYDAEGNPVVSSYYNCAGFEYAYNGQGLRSMIRYLNTDGKPMVRQDLGYAEVHYEYDAAGNTVAQHYLDTSGEPTVTSSGGYASYLDTYDEKGNCVLSQYFDEDGNPAVRKDQGHSIVKRKYDPLGQLTAVYYCDAAGELMINREEGCAGYRYAYDTLGNRTDVWYVNPDGEDLVMVQESYGYAHISYEYNKFGQEAEVHYYLTEDESAPALVKEKGYSGIRKTYQGNNLFQMEYLGTEGTPVLRSDDGYSVVRYDYDAYGQTVSTLYYGIDMESLIFNQNYGCAGFQYKYDVYGNQTDVCYLGTDNQPILRKDQGFAHIAYQPDDFGNTVHQAYYADLKKNEPTTKKDKGYAYSLSDYQDGRCVETRFYNAQDELTLRLDGGYAIVRYEYDKFGRSLSRSYWGLDDTPVINTEEHYASVRWAYDERGNVTDTWYYGLDGNALCHSEYGYAHVHSQYNALGNEVYEEFRDENDSLVSHKVYGYAYACYEYRNQDGQRHSIGNYYSPDGSPAQRKDLGFARCEDIYDEHGNWIEGRYYDAQGDLVRRSDKDYAIIRKEYDSRNRCTRQTYYDECGEPTVNQIRGCAGFEYTYDEKGNQTFIRYLAPDGGLMIRTGYGFAQAQREYDDQGRLTWEWLQDVDGNPATWEGRGYMFYAILYNDIGKKASEWYFVGQYQLVARSDLGYAYVLYDYNEDGLLSREDYYGPDDERILNSENHCASICYDYDERGNKTHTWYYGTDEKPINREDIGASLCLREFDNLDRQTSISYYGYVDGELQLVNRKDLGYAIMENVYDENGLWLGSNYLDAEGRPVVNSGQGYATLQCTYDENGQIISELFLDADNNPVNASNGRAKWEWEYGPAGNLVNTTGHYAADL